MFGRGFSGRTHPVRGGRELKTPTEEETRGIFAKRGGGGVEVMRRTASVYKNTFRVSRPRFSRTAGKINNHALAASPASATFPRRYSRDGFSAKRDEKKKEKSKKYKSARMYDPRFRADTEKPEIRTDPERAKSSVRL